MRSPTPVCPAPLRSVRARQEAAGVMDYILRQAWSAGNPPRSPNPFRLPAKGVLCLLPDVVSWGPPKLGQRRVVMMALGNKTPA
jgi:hypothetical protein